MSCLRKCILFSRYGRIGENGHFHDVDVVGVLRAVVEVELPQLEDGDRGCGRVEQRRPGTLAYVTGSGGLDGTTLPACRAMPAELLCSTGRAWELVESEILELCTFYAWYAYFHIV